MWFIFQNCLKAIRKMLRGEELEKPDTENQETYLERSI